MKEPLLFLCHRIPYPPNKGDKIRSWNLLRYLCEHYRVYLGTFIDDAEDWPLLPARIRDHLRDIPDYDRVWASFVSHEAADLGRPRLDRIVAQKGKVLCWTIRSPEAEAAARTRAHNVTFEGYAAAMPG